MSILALPKNPEPTQPKFKALYWIVFEDPLQLNADANNLLQRFILSLTYFQTSRESDRLACGPSTAANESYRIQDTLGRGLSGSPWLEGVHECQWAGILCDREKNITRLDLRDNGLNGPLPTELANIPALESINIMGNRMTGTVPSIYGSFLSISLLNLDNSELSGSIPSELVPTEVGLFDGTWLGFGSNSLSSSIPTELFQAGKGIHTFLFNDNKFTETLLAEVGALHGRRDLQVNLQGKPLRGTIPSEIGVLKGNIASLDISWTNMEGSLPEELFTECTNLLWFQASNCGLTGTISTGLQLLSKLERFDISNNNFHGAIPAQLSALMALRLFFVNGNDLSGSIPSSVCALADPTKGIFEVAADCLPMDGTGNPMVECSCCTLCCDRDAADYCLLK
ncbi:STYKc [Seminavis robusta]|uniref:STYKc n=1 Tax=Seminavis robusta TaxID=568900 RepID=A0A9N8E8I6_9STRA|nr:STYKc [Seminavis robusta]|eukprot:Sro801_g204390.1 STYKc (397) ;mRNA; f:1528-2989